MTAPWLLDGNLLVALRIDTHIHHARAHHWFARMRKVDRFATCAVTEGTLLRVHMKLAADTSAAAAWRALDEVRAHRQHVFWDAGLSYSEVKARGVQGSLQVTDAWLAEVARRFGGRVATLDGGFVASHPDVASLVPA